MAYQTKQHCYTDHYLKKIPVFTVTKCCPCNKKIFLRLEKLQLNIFYIFNIFAQNIICVYTLEQPYRGGSNEYPQSMFWSKNKKKK